MVLLENGPPKYYGPSKYYINIPVSVMVLLKMGPMGPRGLGPNPFSTVSPCPPGVFFAAKKAFNKI